MQTPGCAGSHRFASLLLLRPLHPVAAALVSAHEHVIVLASPPVTRTGDGFGPRTRHVGPISADYDVPLAVHLQRDAPQAIPQRGCLLPAGQVLRAARQRRPEQVRVGLALHPQLAVVVLRDAAAPGSVVREAVPRCDAPDLGDKHRLGGVDADEEVVDVVLAIKHHVSQDMVASRPCVDFCREAVDNVAIPLSVEDLGCVLAGCISLHHLEVDGRADHLAGLHHAVGGPGQGDEEGVARRHRFDLEVVVAPLVLLTVLDLLGRGTVVGDHFRKECGEECVPVLVESHGEQGPFCFVHIPRVEDVDNSESAMQGMIVFVSLEDAVQVPTGQAVLPASPLRPGSAGCHGVTAVGRVKH
mmetsp:Transcript_37546/g.87201  ORF Transcript_37546/g.87201 Transcript_37546/m.87201 type:complete len:357 (-) Transcript_37546:1015-2085(-)